MRVFFIRHGMTAGNKARRYLGRSDEPLSEEGMEKILEYKNKYGYPEADVLFSSPLVRAKKTLELLYPGKSYEIVDEMIELDFGDFEGKTYDELASDPIYCEWLESNGTLTFPNGESMDIMKKRCSKAFLEIMNSDRIKELEKNDPDASVGFVVHGGTIMSVMSSLAEPRLDYFDYSVKNGNGYIGEYHDGIIGNIEKLISEE